MARTQPKPKRSSAHAKARLEERLPPAVAERGYELLRDRELLADLIASAAADDPRIGESERVALALAAQEPCAHLVATRTGEGVTTLAAGMVHALPTVSFARVSKFLEWQASMLQARIEVRKTALEDERSPLVRAFVHPHRVTREEFERLQKLAPLLSYLTGKHIDDAIEATVEVEPPKKPWPEQKLNKLWRLYVRGILFLTLEGFDCEIRYLLRNVGAADIALSSRSIWHMANRPEDTLDAIARSHDAGLVGALTKLLARVYVLPALATRQPAYHKDAKRLAAALAPGTPMPWLDATSESLIHELIFRLVVHLPLLMPPVWKDKGEVTSERVLRAAQIAEELLKARGSDVSLLEVAEAVSPWHAETIRALDPLQAIGQPRQTRVRATAALDDSERLRVSMWRGILWEWPLPIRGGETFMAQLVSLAPLEALAPLDAPDPALSLSSGRAYLTGRLFQMKRMAEITARSQPSKDGAPEVDVPMPSRNAPCTCGSGKKLKRCCGLKKGPLSGRSSR